MGGAVIKAGRSSRQVKYHTPTTEWWVPQISTHQKGQSDGGDKTTSLSEASPKMFPLETTDRAQLYELLFEPVAQTLLSKHAESIDRVGPLMCWAEIEEFKNESTDSLRILKAVDIFKFYIKPDAPLQLRTASQLGMEQLGELISAHALEGSHIPKNFFEALQHLCFSEIFDDIYLSFKDSDCCAQLQAEVKTKYNRVQPGDFEYFDVLGKGSFGVVYKARKKSTKVFYAVKMMAKVDLARDLPIGGRVATEVNVLTAVRHPFVVGMDYSFQDDHFAFIAMELAVGGTLCSIPSRMNSTVLKEEQLQFYIAEVVEALHYLHGIGLIYRDLKPPNILIDYDGHVKLADLGGVTDTTGELNGRCFENVTRSLYAVGENISLEFNRANLENPRKRKSLLGSPGFMAPEVLELVGSRHRFAEGYSYAADYWSLGVLSYFMITANLPFRVSSDTSVDHEIKILKDGGIEFPSSTSAPLVNFICALLEVEETVRLGFGADGINNIKSHPFFSNFDWSKVMRRECKPPFVPSSVISPSDKNTAPEFVEFDNLNLNLNKNSTPTAVQDDIFEDWNYIAPITLRIEFGMANAGKQYAEKEKLQKNLGTESSLTFSSLSSRATSSRSAAENAPSPSNSSTSKLPKRQATLKQLFSSAALSEADQTVSVSYPHHQSSNIGIDLKESKVD